MKNKQHRKPMYKVGDKVQIDNIMTDVVAVVQHRGTYVYLLYDKMWDVYHGESELDLRDDVTEDKELKNESKRPQRVPN